jgi:hypothetical protein
MRPKLSEEEDTINNRAVTVCPCESLLYCVCVFANNVFQSQARSRDLPPPRTSIIT